MEKNKTIKRLSAVLFAVLLLAALVLSVLTKGFTDWRFGKEQPTVNDLNSNIVITPQGRKRRHTAYGRVSAGDNGFGR